MHALRVRMDVGQNARVAKGRSLYPKGLCADDDFTASHCGLSGTGFLNEAASRWADCLPPMEIGRRDRLPVDPS